MSLRKIVSIFACLVVLLGFSGCFGSGGGGGGDSNNELRPVSGGFLWKPRSESNGNLVILFPSEFRGRAAGAAVHSEDPPRAGNLIEQGNFAGDTHNGNRVHYRFNRPGSAFGSNVYAVLTLSDGQTVSYFIPNGGSRIE